MGNSSLIIRKAEGKDVPLILDFIKSLAEYEKAPESVTATEEILKESLFGEGSVAYCLIAELEGKAAGFAIYFFNFSTWLGKPGLYIEDIFVKPEFRGEGIGKVLFNELVQIAKDKKCGRMDWAVLDWNQPAIDFYKKLGAKPLSEWVGYRLEEQAISSLEHSKL